MTSARWAMPWSETCLSFSLISKECSYFHRFAAAVMGKSQLGICGMHPLLGVSLLWLGIFQICFFLLQLFDGLRCLVGQILTVQCTQLFRKSQNVSDLLCGISSRFARRASTPLVWLQVNVVFQDNRQFKHQTLTPTLVLQCNVAMLNCLS